MNLDEKEGLRLILAAVAMHALISRERTGDITLGDKVDASLDIADKLMTKLEVK